MKKILFACAENKKRSQMAEAIFNSLSKNTKAVSAGTMPAQEVDPLTIQVLKEVGITTDSLKPKTVTDEMLKEANLIVSFGCLVPSMFPKDKFQEWHIQDPTTIEEFRTVRDELTEKIKNLLQKID
jgi:arsenate reductase